MNEETRKNMKVFCTNCGGKDIQQQATIMVEINKEIVIPDLYDFEWGDYYYCMNCMDEVEVLKTKGE